MTKLDFTRTRRIIDDIRERWPDVTWKYDKYSGWYLASDGGHARLTMSMHDDEDDDDSYRIFRYFPDGSGKIPEEF